MLDRDFKGIWIPKEIWLNENLSIVEKALLAEIDSLDNDNHCTAGNEYFTKFFGVSESTITRAITHLKELGFIESSFDGRIRTLRVVKMTTQGSQNDDGINISSNISIKTDSNNQQELFTDKNTNNIEVRNKAQKFVEDYNSICKSLPRCTRITIRRSKGISNILKKFSQEEILEVFNNLENSDFCKGKNDSGWKASIDFILNEDKFVRTLEGKYNNKRSCKAETITPGEKYRVSAEEKEEMRKAVERGELKEY